MVSAARWRTQTSATRSPERENNNTSQRRSEPALPGATSAQRARAEEDLSLCNYPDSRALVPLPLTAAPRWLESSLAIQLHTAPPRVLSRGAVCCSESDNLLETAVRPGVLIR
ncbi:unnamed protein product [Pleuronectes platessa]|uniref:Uncharacterized protein n=1 Tax=Pleuronectes platessa TaxID=8262 RepID=A0A9N7V4W4_PLEPL|nr:unnamed protein product [Pleuronectes platessa]